METQYVIDLLNELANQTAAINNCTLAEALEIVCDTQTEQLGLQEISDGGNFRDFEAPNGDTVTCWFENNNQAIFLEDGEIGFEYSYCEALA